MTDVARAVEKAGIASEDAHRRADIQREKLAQMSSTDPSRPAEEDKLRSMVEATAAADDALTKSLDAEEADYEQDHPEHLGPRHHHA